MNNLTEKGVYQVEEKTGVTDDPINVYYFRPTTWEPGDDIVVAMHGIYRDAENQLEDLSFYANKKNFLLVCPEFSNEKYPGSRYYNNGNVMSEGKLQDKEDWVFSSIDRILNDVKTKFNSLNSKTLLYGHSAGAQIVHRYVLFNDDMNFDLIVSANAGGYTMPDSTISFPYGVGGVPMSNEEWKTIFSKPVVILLGEEDTVPDDNLNVSAASNAQGKNRFERGKNFYEQMKNKAKELNAQFNWELSTVPEVGHNYYKMAKPALEIFSETAQSILTLANSVKSPVTISSEIKIVDASKRTKAVKITGNSFSNTIRGGSSKDTISGGAGADKLYGNAGNDSLDGGAGNDSLNGDKGNDILDGGKGNDLIQGGAGADKLYGKAGNDLLSGGKGNDVLCGDSGDDTLDGGNDNDSLWGGTGNDSLIGGNGKDTLSGETGNDKLFGNSGDDLLGGGNGKDTLSGGTGNDELWGDAGNDSLSGGKGNDILVGGKGNDSLWGDDGADKFIYAKGDGNDVIFGFDSKDTLTLDNITFKTSMTSYNRSQGALTLNVGGGSITLKDLNTTTSLHINNGSYRISGTKLVKN